MDEFYDLTIRLVLVGPDLAGDHPSADELDTKLRAQFSEPIVLEDGRTYTTEGINVLYK